MRISGSGNPLRTTTRPGKLPQKTIARVAAAGNSSYGNQIGLATGPSTSSITRAMWPSTRDGCSCRGRTSR